MKKLNNRPKIDNVKITGKFKKIIKILFILGVAISILIGLIIFYVYATFSEKVSSIPPKSEYKPSLVTKVYSDNLNLIGEYSTEFRDVIEYEKMPKLLIKAFIASEDIEFYEHSGLNYLGIVRAMIKNIKAGHIVQGGSSISQQVAKSFLSDEEKAARSYKRKIKEVIMARRAEQIYNKEYMMYLYLNQIYLGHGAYGVQATARHYFNKNVWDLDLSEITLIAGLPQAPSKFSPYSKTEMAKKRRLYVLRRMLKEKFITKEEMDNALKKKIKVIHDIPSRANYYVDLTKLFPNHVLIYDYGVRIDTLTGEKNLLTDATYTNAPYFSEYAHKVIQKLVGEKEFYTGGYKIYTTVNLEKQKYARDAIKYGLGNLSWRQGYYGPVINDEVGKVTVKEVLYSSKQLKNAKGGIIYKKDQVLSNKEIGKSEIDKKLAEYTDLKKIKNKNKIKECITINKEYESYRKKINGKIHFIEKNNRVIYNHCLKKIEYKKFFENSKEYYKEDKEVPFKRYLALVVKAGKKEATVKFGKFEGKILLKNTKWAEKANPMVHYSRRRVKDLREVFNEGYVIWIRIPKKEELDKKGNKVVYLSQLPKPQAAILSVDYKSGYVKAMIGGKVYSDFNRVLQAERQSGSIFKPLYYSKAVDEDYNLSTTVYDTPIVSYDYLTKVNWKPANYENSYKGKVTLRTALKNSMNVPSIKVFRHVGIEKATKWVHKLGITTALNQDDSMALGSSAIKPVDITKAFSIFANYGKNIPFIFIKKVVDRNGKIIIDNTKYYDPFISQDDIPSRLEAALFEETEQLIDPVTAFLTLRLLRAVVKSGTSTAVNSLKIPIAGKTGTTNDSFDAWFVGFSTSLLNTVWVGYDLNDNPLGKGEAGGKTALPIWKEYAKNALRYYIKNKKEVGFKPPKGVTMVRIDRETGKKAGPSSIVRIEEAFRIGTEPKVEDVNSDVNENELLTGDDE